MTEIYVTLTQYSEDYPQGLIVADGFGELDDQKLSYHEKEDITAFHEVHIHDNGIEMIRHSEVTSHTQLIDGGFGESIIKSPWGDMFMTTHLNYLEVKENELTVIYDLLQDETPVLSQKLVWHWEERHE